MRLNSPNLKIVLFPTFLALVLTVMSLLVVLKGYEQVDTKIKETKKIESDERVLNGKLSILRKIRSGVLEKTNVAVLALPEDNPATQLLSQIKKHSVDVPLLIEKVSIKTREKGEDEVIKSDFDIDTIVLGDKVGVMSAITYLELLTESIPITSYEKIEIESKRGEVLVSIGGFLYRSSFPTELPPLTEPINELTETEEALISELSELSKPDFSVLDPTEASEDRKSPFLQTN